MESYPTAAALRNPFVPPDYQPPTWSYEQRAARFGAQHRDWKHGRGMKRRQRRELSTQNVQTWLGALFAGKTTLQIGRRRPVRYAHAWRVLMYARIEGRAPALYDLRAKIRVRLDALARFGPASGWGVEDPGYAVEPGHDYVRYVVPKTSEKVWRWYLALARELVRLHALLDAWWSRLFPASAATDADAAPDEATPAPEVVPSHHPASIGRDPGKKPRSSAERESTQGQGYRDHLPVELRALLRRYAHREDA